MNYYTLFAEELILLFSLPKNIFAISLKPLELVYSDSDINEYKSNKLPNNCIFDSYKYRERENENWESIKLDFSIQYSETILIALSKFIKKHLDEEINLLNNYKSSKNKFEFKYEINRDNLAFLILKISNRECFIELATKKKK